MYLSATVHLRRCSFNDNPLMMVLWWHFHDDESWCCFRWRWFEWLHFWWQLIICTLQPIPVVVVVLQSYFWKIHLCIGVVKCWWMCCNILVTNIHTTAVLSLLLHLVHSFPVEIRTLMMHVKQIHTQYSLPFPSLHSFVHLQFQLQASESHIAVHNCFAMLDYYISWSLYALNSKSLSLQLWGT